MLPSRNMGNAKIGKCGWSGNAGRELEGENIWQDIEEKRNQKCLWLPETLTLLFVKHFCDFLSYMEE